MAKATNIKDSIASGMMAIIATAMDTGGELIIFGAGTNDVTVPTNCDVDISGSDYVTLVTLATSADAFGAVSAVADSHQIAANAIATVTAAETGTALFFRGCEATSAGYGIIQGKCGTTTDFDMTLNTSDLVQGATIQITSWTISLPQTKTT